MGLVVKSMAVATVVSAIYALFFYRSEKTTESLYGVIYGWFAFIALQWISPGSSSDRFPEPVDDPKSVSGTEGKYSCWSTADPHSNFTSLVESTTMDTHH